MKITIALPCFNEEENIKRIPAEVLPVLEKIGYDFEIIIVDDGSVDNSVAEVKKIENFRVHLLKHNKNLGMGAALQTAIKNANSDIFIALDSDFTFHPNLIPSLLKAFQDNPEIDCVIGSPYLGGYDKKISSWRIILSKIASFIYSLLLNQKMTAITQIFRLYKTDQLKQLNLASKGFEINAEILFKLILKGKKIREIPVSLTKRIYGTSRLNYFKEIKKHLFLVLKIIKWRISGNSK